MRCVAGGPYDVVGPDGAVLATCFLREQGTGLVGGRFLAAQGVVADDLLAAVRRRLPGVRLSTQDEPTAELLTDGGLPLVRVATDMLRDLDDLPDRREVAVSPARYDEALLPLLRETSENVDTHVRAVRALFDQGLPAPLLPSASGRALVDGDVAGHVLTGGPAPWSPEPTAWVFDLAVRAAQQGRGLGAALLMHALHGAREVGVVRIGLTVTDGNPARRLYQAAGFRPHLRSWSVAVPG